MMGASKLTGAILTLNGVTGVDVGVGLGGSAAGAGCAAGGDFEGMMFIGIIRKGDSGVGGERYGRLVVERELR